ncbi:hypothetical protein F4810DRAFT_707676 [Camillea tinctor]|nr:hypothetical protein F4810DRAFT_707676 [Camillea tinctor]
MEPATIPRMAPLDLSVRSRSLHSCSPRADPDELNRMPMFSWSENKAIEPTLPEYPISSPIASSFRSSFSQESTADSGSTVSTGPSTPRTPRAKCEVDDTVQFDLSCIPATYAQRTLKRKSEPPEDEDAKRVKLPGLQHLLESPEYTHRYHDTAPKPRRHLQTSKSSPQPESEYTFSKRPSMLTGEDPITQALNMLRKENNQQKDILPRVVGLSKPFDAPVDPSSKPHGTEEKWPSKTLDYCYQPHQPPSSPKQKIKKMRAKSKDPHCNIKYSQEEKDFLRYYNKELKFSWREITQFFAAKFPMTSKFTREVQGVQGVHYRDNQHIPDIVPRRNQLVFLPNGHVAATVKKVRQQGNDRRKFGLVYLYPERALKYDWVREEDKRLAAEILRERLPQRAQARRDAMKRGLWVEKFDDSICACCSKDDRQRYNDNISSSTNDDKRIPSVARPLSASYEWLKLARL